jgi:hypothetical protein
MTPSSMPRPFSSLAAVAALLSSIALAGAVGCSSSSHSSGGSSACQALEACCNAISGPSAGACTSSVNGATDSACAAALATFVQAGACTGVDAGLPGIEGGAGADSGLPCSITGTCTGIPEAGAGVDTGTSPSGPQCQAAGTCADGETFEACVENSAGSCNAAIVFTDGTVFPCASCTDCAAASASAEAHCGTTTTTVDASVPDCGTVPALHTETEAGVYCPFTAAGSVHCAASQECCETPSIVTNGSTCLTTGTACPITGSLSWECNGPLDCAGSGAGAVCCAGGTVSVDTTCDFDRGSSFTGSHCATSCATAEVTICSALTDPCAAGTECTPFKVAGVVLGACL